MNNTNKLVTLALLTLLALNGCGGGSSTAELTTAEQITGEIPTVDVRYTLNGTERPTCHNADDVGKLNPTPNDYIFCIWLCGSYQGSETVTVSLTFEKNPKTKDGIWELDGESLREASPLTCKDI